MIKPARGVVGFDVEFVGVLLAAADCGDESIIAVGEEQRHRCFGKIATVAGLPLIVHVGQDGADKGLSLTRPNLRARRGPNPIASRAARQPPRRLCRRRVRKRQ